MNKITGKANQPQQPDTASVSKAQDAQATLKNHQEALQTPTIHQTSTQSKNQQKTISFSASSQTSTKDSIDKLYSLPTNQNQQNIQDPKLNSKPAQSTGKDSKQTIDTKVISEAIKSEQADKSKLEKLQQAAFKDKKEFKAKVGIFKQISSIFSNKIKIDKNDVEGLLGELEVSFLESDVAYVVAQKLVADLEKNLVGQEIEKSKLDLEIQSILRKSLKEILSSNTLDFDLLLEQKLSISKPVKILFVGPNGAGKTTTIAKIAKRLQDQGRSVVIAAADTFRAAAIEQLEKHSHKLGIKLIKNTYGSDPAAVAFDAIKYAKTHNIDVVLIDSAGRQETNINLLDQLKKIVRVNSPDIKIYVGESIAGNAIVDQIITFHKEIHIDAAILTKLDCDPKGGTAISITYVSSIPIIFFGVGQDYSDLQKFNSDWIINNILPSKAS